MGALMVVLMATTAGVSNTLRPRTTIAHPEAKHAKEERKDENTLVVRKARKLTMMGFGPIIFAQSKAKPAARQ
jgi:hypothetical protein